MSSTPPRNNRSACTECVKANNLLRRKDEELATLGKRFLVETKKNAELEQLVEKWKLEATQRKVEVSKQKTNARLQSEYLIRREEKLGVQCKHLQLAKNRQSVSKKELEDELDRIDERHEEHMFHLMANHKDQLDDADTVIANLQEELHDADVLCGRQEKEFTALHLKYRLLLEEQGKKGREDGDEQGQEDLDNTTIIVDNDEGDSVTVVTLESGDSNRSVDGYNSYNKETLCVEGNKEVKSSRGEDSTVVMESSRTAVEDSRKDNGDVGVMVHIVEAD